MAAVRAECKQRRNEHKHDVNVSRVYQQEAEQAHVISFQRQRARGRAKAGRNSASHSGATALGVRGFHRTRCKFHRFCGFFYKNDHMTVLCYSLPGKD